MADPTQENRDLVKLGLSKVLPGPAGDSLRAKLAEDNLQTELNAKNATFGNKPIPGLGTGEVPQEGLSRNIAQQAATTEAQAVPELVAEEVPQQTTQMPGVGLDNISSQYKHGLGQEAQAIEKQSLSDTTAIDKSIADQEKVNLQIEDIQRQKTEQAAKDLAVLDTAQKDLDSQKIEPHSFFHGMSTWQKVLGGIGLFLGSLTPQGAQNIASIIDKTINRDVEAQKMQWQLKKGRVDSAQNRYKFNLDKYSDDVLAKLATKKEQLLATQYAIKRNEAAAKGEAAKGKMNQGAALTDIKIMELESQMIARKAALLKAQGGDKPTENQTTSAGYATRAEDAENNLGKLGKSGFDPSSLKRVITGNLPNIISSENEQSFQQAKKNFITAVLRKESGANIPIPEYEIEEAKYFDQPGDSDKVRQQKKQARLAAIASLKNAAGKEYQKVRGANSISGFKPL